jgi:hypothetical protein
MVHLHDVVHEDVGLLGQFYFTLYVTDTRVGTYLWRPALHVDRPRLQQCPLSLDVRKSG